MPRRPSNVNQADLQRVIRACRRERVPFRVTLQPNGAAVFDEISQDAKHAAGDAHDLNRGIVVDFIEK